MGLSLQSNMNLDARTVATALGGDVVGRDAVSAPGPGHSREDRSVKRRFAKQRMTPAAELREWEAMFEAGAAFAGEPEALGFSGDQEDMRAAAPKAWRRLGDLFLATWKPTDVRPTPWALEQFGEPKTCR